MSGKATLLAIVLFFVVMFYGSMLLLSATSPCNEWRGPLNPAHELRGWHRGVKCYNGNVIDYR